MIISFKNWQKILHEAFLEKLDSEYLKEVIDRTVRGTNDNIREIEIKIFKNNTIQVFTEELTERAEYTVERLLKKINDGDCKKLPDALGLEIQDLVGWNLVNVFKHGDRDYFMTFEKDGRQEQFELEVFEGEFNKYYEVTTDTDSFNYESPNSSFNNQVKGASMYDISQMIKGKVIKTGYTTVMTENGEIGYKSTYWNGKIHMKRREEITPCHLENKLTLKVEGNSRYSASRKAYRETRHYCIDVLSSKTPSDSYLEHNTFSIEILLKDERDDSTTATLWDFGDYKYNSLGSSEYPYIKKMSHIIDKLNTQNRSKETERFNYGKITEFIKHFEKELADFEEAEQ